MHYLGILLLFYDVSLKEDPEITVSTTNKHVIN